jgi:hypothetical protein
MAAYTVLIPYESDLRFRTKWHPTESKGPFKVLSRGVFPSRGTAREWALSRGIRKFRIKKLTHDDVSPPEPGEAMSDFTRGFLRNFGG